MSEIIAEFKARGGIVAVDSHSVAENIIRDYKANNLPDPDIIYGWDIPKEMRKPAPGTLFDLMEKYNLRPEEILVVDDLKPGYDMARGAGAHFAAAGWAYDVPEIAEFMKKNCDYYLKSVDELRALLGQD
jgi:phosphoglycolate phosphatase/pyrophosphatase PpaX